MFNAPLGYEIDDFSPGWDNISKPSTMQKGGFREMKNFNITRHKGIEKRGGMTKLYPSAAGSSKITGFYEYNAPDGNIYNLTAIETTIKAFYEAAWHELKTGLTADMKYNFTTHLGLCYGVNGVDPNFKLHNDIAYQVGITPPVAAPNVVKISPGSDVKIEEYAETNQDHCGELRVTSNQTRLAQNFSLAKDAKLTKIKLLLKKIGSPTGNLWIEIHSDKIGTQVGGDTATLDVSTIASAFTEYELEFTGTQPELVKNTDYYMVIYGDFAISATNFIVVGFDQSAPTYDSTKKYWEVTNGTWTGYQAVDLVFEIYGTYTEAELLLESGILETGKQAPLRQGTGTYLVAQSFKLTADGNVGSVKLALKKYGSPTGNLWAEIHSSQVGTSPTKNASTNIVGEASDDVPTSEISVDYEWITFTFSGTAPSLTADTTYYIVLYCDYTPSSLNCILWTKDEDYYADGSQWNIDDEMAWTEAYHPILEKYYDCSFKIYGSTTAEIKVIEYPLANLDDIKNHRETTSQALMAQSLEVTTESTVTRIKLWLAKIGTPTGNIWVEIHDGQDGTSVSKNTSTYQVGEASDNIDVATLGAFPAYGWVEFTFSGTKPPLVKGKTYYIVLYGDYVISATNHVAIGVDKIDPQYVDGNRWDIASGSPMVWTAKDYIDLIFELYMTAGGLTGKYKHKYCYKRTAFADLISNPSEASDLTEPANEKMRVSLVASTDPQVDKIILYRTLDIPAGTTEDPLYYKAVELSNEDQDYDDALADGALTILLEEDNTIPPKAKFTTTHKDRVFYANCPDEESGGQLVRWSKGGKGEACPLSNYQYFDRDDGEEITAIISHRDNLLVFKPNKIGILAGNLDEPLSCEISYLSLGIGCIASWAILPLEDKVLFLSEEGWKATDGNNIYNISSKINGLVKDGYITINENENYSVAYYPKNEQFQFLMNHSALDPMVTVGHFLIPLMLASKGIIGISEKVLGDMVGWTYHQYDNHNLTCLGNYTDDDGITRVIAGSNNGYVYLLDSGLSDDGSNIHTKLRTDWLALGRPKSHTKITRQGYLGYCVSDIISLEIQEDVDFAAGGDPAIITGSTRGIDNALRESFSLAGTGELFRYTLSEVSSQALAINEFSIRFRDIGAR